MQNVAQKLVESQRYGKAKMSLRKYGGAVEFEDLEAEFNVGIMVAAEKVKEIGDPLEYLVAQAMWRVQHYVRAELCRIYIQVCMACGKERPYRHAPCSRCSRRDFELSPRQVALNVTDGGEVIGVGRHGGFEVNRGWRQIKVKGETW